MGKVALFGALTEIQGAIGTLFETDTRYFVVNDENKINKIAVVYNGSFLRGHIYLISLKEAF